MSATASDNKNDQVEIKTEKSKVITCILPKGTGHELMVYLEKEKGICTASHSTARGTGMVRIIGRRGFGQSIEKDVITVVVPNRQADDLFDEIYIEMNVNRPHGGFIYMAKLQHSVPFVLPEMDRLDDEEFQESSPSPRP